MADKPTTSTKPKRAPRKKPGSKPRARGFLTVDRLPEEIQSFFPEGLSGAKLGEAYFIFSQGVEAGRAEAGDLRAQLADMRQLLMALLQDVSTLSDRGVAVAPPPAMLGVEGPPPGPAEIQAKPEGRTLYVPPTRSTGNGKVEVEGEEIDARAGAPPAGVTDRDADMVLAYAREQCPEGKETVGQAAAEKWLQQWAEAGTLNSRWQRVIEDEIAGRLRPENLEADRRDFG